MMLLVRTTVTLDPDVEQLIRDAMQRNRKGFKETLNDAVRSGLGGQSAGDEPRFVVHARPMGVRAGIDARGFNRLFDELETDSVVTAAERPAPGDRLTASDRPPSDEPQGPAT